MPLTATTASGNFELVREYMGGETPAPPATGNLVAAGSWISGGRKSTGTFAYVRALWRHISSGTMRVAWSQEPFQIEGLPGTPVGTWPAIKNLGTGNGELGFTEGGTRFFAAPVYASGLTDGDGYGSGSGGNFGLRGAGFAIAAYAAFTGDTTQDAFVLQSIRSAITAKGCPSLQGGYSAQHDNGFLVMAYWVKQTPRLWTGTSGLTSTEREKIEWLMKAAAVAFGAVCRETGEGHKNMVGNPNSSTNVSNANIRCPNRFNVVIAAAFMGVAAAKAWMDSITTDDDVEDIYDNLVRLKLDNAADSFNPVRPDMTGKPNAGKAITYAQIVNKMKQTGGWKTFGNTILNADKILIGEIEFTFSRECMVESPNERGYVLRTASTALTALVAAKSVGAIMELATYDSGPQGQGSLDERSSMFYGILGFRPAIQTALIGLHSGILDRTKADVKAAMAKLKVGVSHAREITRDSVGWYSYAHQGKSQTGAWYHTRNVVTGRNSQKSYRYGSIPWFAMGDVISAVVDQTAVPTYAVSYYENYTFPNGFNHYDGTGS